MNPEISMEATQVKPISNNTNLKSHFTRDYVEYQGFWYAPSMLQFIKAAQDEFRPQPGDVMLATCPKSGTTWLKALAFAIMTRDHYGGEGKPPSPLLSTSPHHCVPYIEKPYAKRPPQIERFGPKLRLFSTHLPYTSLPQSVLSCKVVYLCREPKDMFVSWWHFWCNIANDPAPLDELFPEFCEGKNVYGPWWDHILGYWIASREKADSVLFLKYEDLKKDTIGFTKKLAEFMGSPFSYDEEEAGRVEEVVKLCSFENLSNLEVNKLGKYETSSADVFMDNQVLFRKGEVGGWKQHLTSTMKETIDGITKEKFSGYDGLNFSKD